MICYLLATEQEAEIFRKLSKGKVPRGEIEVIDDTDVKKHADDVVVHIGYADGYDVAAGTLVEPVYVIDAQTQEVVRTDTVFPTEHRICFSSERAVKAPMVDFPAVYDAGLFKIAESQHKRIHAIKIIKGNIGKKAQKEFNCEEAWMGAVNLISRYVKE